MQQCDNGIVESNAGLGKERERSRSLRNDNGHGRRKAFDDTMLNKKDE